MSNAIGNNSPMASHYDHKSDFHADEATFSQPSTASSPFNSFIVEYDIGAVNLYPHTPKDPNGRLTLSGELGQPVSAFSRHSNMLPPPAQLMGGEYDPNRIPGSAFCNKNATPVEWSVASNESLFSIHTGNASFNRDHLTFFRKSQELTKFDDMMNASSGLPQLSGAVRDNANINGLHHVPGVVLPGTSEDQKKEVSTGTGERVSAELSSTPRNSNGSNSGVQAFSFPILDTADTRNSLGKLSLAEVNKHKSYLETPKATRDNEVVMNSPVAAAATPTAKSTNWFAFSCCRG